MKYDIYVITKNNGITDYSKEHSFNDLKKAEKQLDKVKNKHKKAKVVLVPIPDYGVGYDIYSKGNYYGTIIKESVSFWIISNLVKEKTGEPLKDQNEFLKEGFEIHFVKGEFDSVEKELEE